MKGHQFNLVEIIQALIRKPFSFLTGVFTVLLILVPLFHRMAGKIYIQELNYVDGTTLIMVGVLLLRGIVSLRRDTDLQAFSIALVGALSFVFVFEALYKLAFYLFPWRMPPTELREFVIQVGIAMTALTGFAFKKFRMTRFGWIFTAIFVAGWALWLLVGFPQLANGQPFYSPIVDVDLSMGMIYILNRTLKFVLFLVFFSFYNGQQKTDF
jgi:hypothetical protein